MSVRSFLYHSSFFIKSPNLCRVLPLAATGSLLSAAAISKRNRISREALAVDQVKSITTSNLVTKVS